MAKPTSFQCNLKCHYCYYLDKQNSFDDKRQQMSMSDEVLEQYIKQMITATRGQQVEFAWQGGEPTLAGLAFFEKAIDLQQKYANGKQITNALQTNGVLLNDKWASFFKKHNFLIGLSIDGPKALHDTYRTSRADVGSFDKVMRGIHYLKKHQVPFNTLTVITDKSVPMAKEIYHFLVDELGSQYLQFIPIVERRSRQDNQLVFPKHPHQADLTPWSVSGASYGEFMVAIFNQWVKRDVGRIFVQSFDNALEAWFGQQPSLCVLRKHCADALVLEQNGDIYQCDHFVYPEYRLGNILTTNLARMSSSRRQTLFGAEKSNLCRRCKQCQFQSACNGGCPKHRIGSDSGAAVNHLCDGYQMFFEHIDPYMRFMVSQLEQGLAPKNVMHHILHIEANRGQTTAVRHNFNKKRVMGAALN